MAASSAAAAATGALRRVLLPAIRRRLTTGAGQPLISFTGARAGTTKAHQAEVAARRLLRKQKLREDGLSGMVDHVGMWLIITGAAPFTFLYGWALLRRDPKPQDCSHQSGSSPENSVYES